MSDSSSRAASDQNQTPAPVRGWAYLVALLRSWLHLLVMGTTLVVYATTLMVTALFVRGETVYRIGVAWLSICVRSAQRILGIRYRVTGMEHFPEPRKGQGVVILVKHQSTYETFLMPNLLRHVVLSYVFKKELLSIPFFGWGIGRMDMVHIDRKQGAKSFHKVLEQGKRLIDMGNWIIMFPEGTRVARGQVGNYKTSGARLAIETGSVVIPVAVASARCWAPRAIVKYPGIVDVSVGAPIATEGKTPNDLMQEVESWIETEMRRIDPQAYPAATAPANSTTPQDVA